MLVVCVAYVDVYAMHAVYVMDVMYVVHVVYVMYVMYAIHAISYCCIALVEEDLLQRYRNLSLALPARE